MKPTPAAIVVLAAVVALVGFAGFSPVPAQLASKAALYEYKFLPLTQGNVQHDEKNLNEAVADGWEVVVSTSSVKGGNGPVSQDTRLVLKRAKR
jgi:hypothetical protein